MASSFEPPGSKKVLNFPIQAGKHENKQENPGQAGLV